MKVVGLVDHGNDVPWAVRSEDLWLTGRHIDATVAIGTTRLPKEALRKRLFIVDFEHQGSHYELQISVPVCGNDNIIPIHADVLPQSHKRSPCDPATSMRGSKSHNEKAERLNWEGDCSPLRSELLQSDEVLMLTILYVNITRPNGVKCE